MEQNQKKLFANVMMVAILIVAMSVGLMSCSNDNKEEPEEEPDLSWRILGKWHQAFTDNILEIKEDGTYSLTGLFPEYGNKYLSVNGIYRIVESKESTVELLDITRAPGEIFDANLYIMNVSGSDVFDQLWIYNFISTADTSQLAIHLYSGNECVQVLLVFGKY